MTMILLTRPGVGHRPMLRTLATLSLAASLLTGCMTASAPERRPDPRIAPVDGEAAPTDETEQSAAGLIEGFRVNATGGRLARVMPTVTEWSGSEAAGIALNFKNADIDAVAQAVLGDALGLPFSVDEGVAGKMTLQTDGTLSRDGILFTFEAALESVGVHLRRQGPGYRLQSAGRTTQNGHAALMGLSGADLRAGYGVHIVPINHLSAERLVETLGNLLGNRAKLRADTERNLLIIEGTGPVRLNAVELVRTFDVDWMAGRHYALVPLEVAEATLVLKELEQVFETQSSGLAEDVIQFMPVERMNALLVITSSETLLTRAEEWIARLDMGGENAGKRLYTYHVQHGRAVDMANVLGSLFGAQQQTAAGPRSSVAPGLDAGFAMSNQTGSTGRARSGDAGGGRQVNFSVAQDQALVSYVSDSMRIVADERKNALLILTTPAEYALIRGSLKRLDVKPLQVMIEATIVEVSLDDNLKFGVQWFLETGDFDFSLTGGTSSSNVQPTVPGFSGVFDDLDDARVVLSALDSVTDVEMLSSPQLMVLNNQTALLQIGDEIPVPSASAVNLSADSDRVFNEISYRSTGIILKVTPRVNQSGTVLLDIEQEVSDVADTITTSGIDAPTVQQRRIVSTVAVQSGETLALGGLIQRTNTVIDAGVPFLSRIPLIGNAFKNNQDRQQRSELLILVTPQLVGTTEQARSVTQELQDRMQRLKSFYDRERP